MIPNDERKGWGKLQEDLKKKNAEEVLKQLLFIASVYDATKVRLMQPELVELICHPLLATLRDDLFDAFGQYRCYPLHRPNWKVEIVEKNGKRYQCTRNEQKDIVEVCGLDNDGNPTTPHIVLDPLRRRGHAKFKTTHDSYSNGSASASAMHGDGALVAEMTYEEWRDATLKWFVEPRHKHHKY